MTNSSSAAATGLPEPTPTSTSTTEFGFDPDQHNLHVLSYLRREIERLLNILDLIDGEPDFEPSLASPECHPFAFQPGPDGEGRYLDRVGSQERWARGSTTDAELDNSDFEANGDEELTLGAPECAASKFGMCLSNGELHRDVTGTQANWAKGDNFASRDDCEFTNEDGGDVLDEPHDAEDEDPREHWLSASEEIDQTGWSALQNVWFAGYEGDGDADIEPNGDEADDDRCTMLFDLDIGPWDGEVEPEFGPALTAGGAR